MKKPTKNYFHCVFAKVWVQNTTRKDTVAREFDNLRPLLGLFASKKRFNVEDSKRFKTEYKVTRQTIRGYSLY